MKRNSEKKRMFLTAGLLIFCVMALTVMTDGRSLLYADKGNAVYGAKKAAESGEPETASDSQSSFSQAYGYTGYLDECRQWEGCTAFAGQDYDGDGKTDRVWRTFQENTGYCKYRIEFGSQTVLDLGRKLWYHGKPVIKAADINSDGKREIIFSLKYETATDMRGFGDTVVFEKKGDTYVRAALPFQESSSGYRQEVTVHYSKKQKQLITVSLDVADFKTDIPVGRVLWKDAMYRDNYKNASYNSCIWDTFLVKEGQKERLACRLHLFDKWSEYGLILVLDYKDGQYFVKKTYLTSDEFSDRLSGK